MRGKRCKDACARTFRSCWAHDEPLISGIEFLDRFDFFSVCPLCPGTRTRAPVRLAVREANCQGLGSYSFTLLNGTILSLKYLEYGLWPLATHSTQMSRTMYEFFLDMYREFAD